MTTTLFKWELMLTENRVYVHTTPIWSACIITADVIDSLQQYHSRMPFFLNELQQQIWVSENASLESVLPILDKHNVLNFESNPVTQAMNNVRFKEPSSLNPLPIG